MAFLLPTTYLGPIQFYARLAAGVPVMIEQHEHYVKQTWRNRCRIGGPNGLQDLVVPVEHYANHTPVNAIRISYREPWQRTHWRSIEAAYGNSPFWEFYAPYYRPFYETPQFELLVELNRALLETTLRVLKLAPVITYTDCYTAAPGGYTDLRILISPRQPLTADEAFISEPYTQVFDERFGFRENLSVLDLLCCAGPESLPLLQRALQKEQH